MMTKLSVNINKIALLRNSRGRDYPSVCEFAERCITLGAHGVTLHPRPDQRHARYSDVGELQTLCAGRAVELNVEGYPSEDFLRVVLASKPVQCTLVPDSPTQVTSDHGWDVAKNKNFLGDTISLLKEHGIRTSLFVDHDCPDLDIVSQMGADRIEIYTEPYAESFHEGALRDEMLSSISRAVEVAQELGLGVNAGHDLSLENLQDFLSISGILEVSIGHALIMESIDHGLTKVIKGYLAIIDKSNGAEAQ